MSLKKTFQPIEWTDEMTIGIATVDKQHHYLVDTLQNANERLLKDHDGALLSQVAKDLLSYAIMHFETEEELMQRYGYEAARPEEAHTHIEQHREFSRRVVAISDQVREGREVSRVEVLEFLNNWLRDHVLGVDQLMGDFLRQAMSETDFESDH